MLRVPNTTVVKLVAYAQLEGVILPKEVVIDYMNYTSAADVSLELEEVVASEQYIAG